MPMVRELSRTSFVNICIKNFGFWLLNVEISLNTKTRLRGHGPMFSCNNLRAEPFPLRKKGHLPSITIVQIPSHCSWCSWDKHIKTRIQKEILPLGLVKTKRNFLFKLSFVSLIKADLGLFYTSNFGRVECNSNNR